MTTVTSNSINKQQYRIIVPVADGSEDMEFASITDVFVRCGIQVITVSCNKNGSEICTLSRGLQIIANGGNIYSEKTLDHLTGIAASVSAIVFPGGMPGAKHLSECEPLIEFTKKLIFDKAKINNDNASSNNNKNNNFILGAICAAPAVALQPNGFLQNVSDATCFPALKGKIASWRNDRVVVSTDSQYHHKVVTSQGPGTAVIFALQISAHLVGNKIATSVADAMLIQDYVFTNSKL